MDNQEQVLIVNATQLQSVQSQFESINEKLAQLIPKKKYKQIYQLLSKFFDRYDHSNQIHLNDKIYFQNILLKALNKIFYKCILKDMSRKNIIDIKIWKQKIVKYLEIYPVLISKLTSNFDMVQIETKHSLRDQIRNSMLKDKLQQQIHITNNNNTKLKLNQIVTNFCLEQEYDSYLQNIMVSFRLLSYQDFKPQEKGKYAKLSFDISKILLQGKGKRASKLSQYILCATNLLIKSFENNNDMVHEILEEVNCSITINYLIYLVQQQDANNDFKRKLKCKWKFMKLLKPLTWFWMQSIYYYQSIFKFEKCQAIMTLLKWLSFYYLLQNDELANYIQNVSSLTYSKYKEFIIFNQVIESVCLDDDVGMPRLKRLMREIQEQNQEKQQYKQSVNYYYNVNDKNTSFQPEFYYCTPQIKVQNQQKKNTDAPFIDVPIENLSSMDTRQSSKTLKCPKRLNTSFNQNVQKSFRGSISQFSTSFSEKKNQSLCGNNQQGQQIQQNTVPMLDKMIKKLIEEKIVLDNIEDKKFQSQQLLSKEKLQQKENDFYKKLLKYKTQFSKFVSPVKMKSNQEVITKQDLQMRIIDRQTLVDSKNSQTLTFQTKQNDQDTSLLSFEKPGVQLGPLQKLKKIIFKHPEVFSLQKLRNKLKSSKKWYNKANQTRISNTRRSVMSQKSKDQQTTDLTQLRDRSQTQLRKKLSETQFQLEALDKEMRSYSVKIKYSRQNMDQPLQLDNKYQILSRSTIKQEMSKKQI
ncbi:unnamed protein product [Paramecium pentaurelia]|uniref:Uncharacterized protein n=1 Tax=Paramecium pentaurelia TaxID=43138 RepID=A0A8S1SNK7_9CILI|nr:unnamed protein product [Paramecium pentaurelia]